MAEHDSELVAAIAESIGPYVRRRHAEEVAVEVLSDLVVDGWQIRHPNDDDIDEHEVGSDHRTSEGPAVEHRR
jgi:hypothetical protein